MSAKVRSLSAFLFLGLAIVFVMAGCGGGSSTTGSNTTATPTFSPGAGKYTSSQPVTISDATSGAVLYCTTDGTTPTTSSPKCSEPATVYQSEFLQAIAVAPGKAASAVASAGYTIDLNTVNTPTFSPGGGTYSSAQQVTISDSVSGANIYYTLDGSMPTQNSSLYTGPVTISSSLTLSAIAAASGYTASGVATAAYVIQSSSSAPTIGSLSPSSAAAGGAAFTLTVNGANFDSGSTVMWGSTALATTFVSATQLTAAVPASLIASAGSVVVSVTTSSGTTAYAAFNVSAAVPPITSLSPSSALAGGAGFTLTVMGSSFDSSSTINWNGSPLTTTYVSATSLTASVPASLIATAGTATITVTSAAGTSNNLTFTINGSATAPTVTGINPSSGAAGTSVTITGTNFTGATAVNFGTTPATTVTVNSATSITAVAPAGTSTVDITVVTPSGTSAAVPADQFTYGGSPGGSSISGVVVSGTTTGLSASVQLYAAGMQNYGPVGTTGAMTVGGAVSTDPSTGAFTISYNCPAAPGDQLYLVATGSNSQVVLMTALGSCAGIQPAASYTINEATTVASVYALQQFMAADGSIGANITDTTSLSYTGLSNAFKTANNLVDLSTGIARDHTPDYQTTFGTGDPNIVNNSTVPQARINTLANALNTCVANSSGCAGLFSAAAVSAGTPANTLQAILDIAQNPGYNAGGVYAVAGGSTAYLPVLAAAPNDWTIALTFTGGGLGIAPTISGVDSAGNSGVGPSVAMSLAIDANGNVFVGGFGEFGYSSQSLSLDLPILAEFNNLGAPVTTATTVSSDATPVITFNGDNLGEAAGSGFAIGSVAVDTNGNIWAGDVSSSGKLYTVAPDLSLLASAESGDIIQSVAIDNQNNAWIARNGFLEEYTYSAGNSALQQQTLAAASSQYSPSTFGLLTFDYFSNLWAYGGGAAPSIYLITSDGSFVYSAYPTRGTASNEYMSMAPDGSGNLYLCGDAGGQTLDVFTAADATAGTAPTTTYPLGSRGCGNQLLLDGAGHLFAISNGYSRIGLDYGTIDEYTTTGVAVSPASGYTGTSSGEQPTITNDANAPLGQNGALSYATISAAIDGSGNLWVINPDTSNSGGSGNATGNVLVEYIGMAAPVVTPTAAALTNAELGVRP